MLLASMGLSWAITRLTLPPSASERSWQPISQMVHTEYLVSELIDATPFADDKDISELERDQLKDFKEVFINPTITNQEGDEWAFAEGCLSIPDIREDVFRQETVSFEYVDENFEKHSKTLNGLAARVFQHEYDHLEGILFTDKLSSLKKRILKKKLEKISLGKISSSYRMRFPNIKI